MLGVFGGTFDPVHFGHIKSALALLEHFDFEQIRFVPCQQSPVKQKVYASARHRWQMLNLVTSSNEKLVVDDRELKLPGPSYTIDTLRGLRNEIENRKTIVLIMGVDAFSGFCQWREYEAILSLCNIMLLQRPGHVLSEQGCERELYDRRATNDVTEISATLSGHIYSSNEKMIEASSTAIRRAIAAGEQPRYVLPGSVWHYICRHNLYQ